jgi:hypothetical protein
MYRKLELLSIFILSEKKPLLSPLSASFIDDISNLFNEIVDVIALLIPKNYH